MKLGHFILHCLVWFLIHSLKSLSLKDFPGVLAVQGPRRNRLDVV